MPDGAAHGALAFGGVEAPGLVSERERSGGFRLTAAVWGGGGGRGSAALAIGPHDAKTVVAGEDDQHPAQAAGAGVRLQDR